MRKLDFAQEADNTLARIGEYAKQLAANAMTLQNLVGLDARLNEKLESAEVRDWYISASAGVLYLHLYQCNSFKALEGVLGVIAETFPDAPMFSEDRPNDGHRCYTFGNKACITAYLRADATGCERVQVGTVTEEVPVYEFHCNEEA